LATLAFALAPAFDFAFPAAFARGLAFGLAAGGNTGGARWPGTLAPGTGTVGFTFLASGKAKGWSKLFSGINMQVGLGSCEHVVQADISLGNLNRFLLELGQVAPRPDLS